MALVRPTSDIASFPSPGWGVAPLFSKVNSVERDDSTFITGLQPGAEDPQVSFGIGDLEIPFGSSGRIEVRIAMRWDLALTAAATVRIGLADAAELGVDKPALLFERVIVGFSSTAFQTIDIAFDYEDFSGDAAAFGIYIEMTPDGADVTQLPEISWIEVLSCVPAVFVEACSLGSLTAGGIITEARDHHPTFDDRKHPDRTLFRLLSSYQRSIVAKVARVNPALCASNLFITLPLADFTEGVTLPSFIYVLPHPTLLSENNLIREPIDLINATLQSDVEQPRKFVYLQGNQLFLGRRAENYAAYTQLRLQLVLTPPDLLTLDDPLVLPDYAEDTYAGHLVSKMAMRETPPITTLAGNASEVEFLTTVAQQKGAEVSHTRDVFPGGL